MINILAGRASCPRHCLEATRNYSLKIEILNEVNMHFGLVVPLSIVVHHLAFSFGDVIHLPHLRVATGMRSTVATRNRTHGLL